MRRWVARQQGLEEVENHLYLWTGNNPSSNEHWHVTHPDQTNLTNHDCSFWLPCTADYRRSGPLFGLFSASIELKMVSSLK